MINYQDSRWNLNQKIELKGVPVKMSGFVFTFCVFPTSFDACYSGLLPEILQAMLEWPKLGFYPKLCVDLVDLSNREQKRQKAKTNIFIGTPFILNLIVNICFWFNERESRII